MNLIEKGSKIIASKTSAILNMDKDQQEILEYGAMNLLHTSLSMILLVLFGALFHTLLEILVISLTAALLRQYSGGVHATSSNRCTVLSLVFFGILSLLAKYVLVFNIQTHVVMFQAITLLFVFIILSKYAPVDNPNKRITNPETRLKFKKASFRFVLFMVIITIGLWGAYHRFSVSTAIKVITYIHIGMLWQALSITAFMRSVIGRLDSLLIKLKFEKGGV